MKARPNHFIQIKPQEYNPSRVMNLGMKLARAEFGIFLNADATPQGANWLRPLVEALQDPQAAAVFGRQIPRPDCRAVFAHDYERCFGANRESTRWEHFFSMVSSGLRKDVWSQRGFLEKLQYSEDDEYTRWCRARGYRVVYVPESVAMHSHNYTPAQAYKRSFGEARALAAVWNGSPRDFNWPRTVFLGWLNDARRDLGYCARTGRWREWPHAARIRWEQRQAKLAGFREGWEFYRTRNAEPETRNFRAPDSAFRVPGKRFTLDGSDVLEHHLAGICDKVLAGVRELVPASKLDALVLGGGYGRGEGGVLKSPAGDLPYNDLEFYVFLHGSRLLNERAYAGALLRLGERLSPEAGLHVEFKIDSLARFRRSAVTMFSYDLVAGHRVLWDSEKHPTSNIQHPTPNFSRSELLDVGGSPFHGCEHHLDASQIPLSEATRLLFNRCTGLLLAKEYLASPQLTPDQADFVGRNLAKAQLAFGDAVLAAFGEYHWSCRERRDRLARLTANWTDGAQCWSCALREPPPWLAEVQRLHADGVEFKLHPRQQSRPRAEFVAEHRALSNLAQQVWLWLETRRLSRRFPSAHDYAFSPVGKCAGTPSWRNRLLNARAFGVGTVFDAMAGRYPRERLLNSLPLLLWDEPMNDLRVRRHLQNQLRTEASDWRSFVAAYKAVWPGFS